MNKLTVAEQNIVTEAYLKYNHVIKRIAVQYANGGKKYNISDVESYLNERFIGAVLKYDTTKHVNMEVYLQLVLTRHADNFTKSAQTLNTKKFTFFSGIEATMQNNNDGDEGGIEGMISKDEALEVTYYRNSHVTETLELLFAKATDLQKRIMQAYITFEGKPTLTQIGKLTGIHHQTVKRELAKLAKLVEFDLSVLDYQSNTFGKFELNER